MSLCSPVTAQSRGIFSGLPYDENSIRAKIVEYTVTADSINAALEIPVNLFYQLLFRQILADKNLQARINPNDIATIRNLPAPWDYTFLRQDQEELGAICAEADAAVDALEIQNLASEFDDSRKRKERQLDIFYATALSELSVETRELIQNLLLDFSTSKSIAYAAFDMAGFAREMPEAAKAILLNGCETFEAQITSYTPRTVTLGDL